MKVEFDRLQKRAVLTIESELERDFLDEIDFNHVLLIDGFDRVPVGLARCNEALRLTLDPGDPRALRQKSGREALSALGKLFGLALAESASHGRVGAFTADPQPQEQFAAELEKLKVVVDALRKVVGEPRLEEIVRSHGRNLGTSEPPGDTAASLFASEIGNDEPREAA